MVTFPPISPPRHYTLPSPHPYAPHVQPISFFSILSPVKYWLRCTNHLAPRNANSSIPPLPRPSFCDITHTIYFMYPFISIPFSLLFGDRSFLAHRNTATRNKIHFLPFGHGFEMCLMTDYISYLLSGRTGLPASERPNNAAFRKCSRNRGGWYVGVVCSRV